jgi:oxalate decarboxylase/phosphoglucose isomerase-like protein (cupin superfamily)
MTGALMRIKAGSLREPHWHPNADEWQYYVAGRARMTVFGSHGRVRTEEFDAGDVGYVPQGYGHYIENAGSEDLELLNRAQQRHLRINLAHRLDGGQSASAAGDQFPRAGSNVQRLPARRTIHAGLKRR